MRQDDECVLQAWGLCDHVMIAKRVAVCIWDVFVFSQYDVKLPHWWWWLIIRYALIPTHSVLSLRLMLTHICSVSY